MKKWTIALLTVLGLALSSIVITTLWSTAVGESSYGNVAYIKIGGVILTETTDSIWAESQDTSSEELTNILNDIKEDDSIKAVIFEINSPGGSGVAADEIATAIKELQDVNKTSVAYIRELGASAAYWIASATDKIYANRMSFVGSIGVIGSYVEFSGLMDDYNISYQRFVGGKYKDFGSPFKSPSEDERAAFQEQIDEVYNIFIDEVATNRNLERSSVEELATGMVYTGSKAKEYGLIDEIGGKEEAIAFIEDTHNISVTLKKYESSGSFLDAFAGSISQMGTNIGKGIGTSILQANQERKVII